MSSKKRLSESYPAALILLIISLISFLGLDYIQSTGKRENSFLFSRLLKERESFYSWIDQELLPFIQQQSGPTLKIIQIADKPSKEVSVKIAEHDYEKLAKKLKDKLIEQGNEYEIKVFEENEKSKTLAWKIRGKRADQASFIFNVTKTLPDLSEPAPELASPLLSLKKRPQEQMAAIIIDDLGDNLDILRTIIELSRPINVAILPFSIYARETAKMAQNHGLEVMLHLPLESINSESNDGNHLIEINSKMSPEVVLMTLRECLEVMPEIRGVNNHMGSLITQNKEIMKIILAEIKSRGLFFVDSRTTEKSIAYKLALEMGLICGQRDVFLDSEVNINFISAQTEQLIRLCQRRGKAIAIGHPYPETIRILPEVINQIERAGIKIVPVSQILSAN